MTYDTRRRRHHHHHYPMNDAHTHQWRVWQYDEIINDRINKMIKCNTYTRTTPATYLLVNWEDLNLMLPPQPHHHPLTHVIPPNFVYRIPPVIFWAFSNLIPEQLSVGRLLCTGFDANSTDLLLLYKYCALSTLRKAVLNNNDAYHGTLRQSVISWCPFWV